MGQKSSSLRNNRFLISLPDCYEKNQVSEIYSLKIFDNQVDNIGKDLHNVEYIKQNDFQINPQITLNKQYIGNPNQNIGNPNQNIGNPNNNIGNPNQNIGNPNKNIVNPNIEINNLSQFPKHDQNNINVNNDIKKLPPFLKHYPIVLNTIYTKQYLNHLVYRNQPQFSQFFIQLPFGEIQKHKKYTKLHLYAQEIILRLNNLSNIPFNDGVLAMYISLIGFKYLYEYFGLFKIEQNMIGFTRQGKTKIWLNKKITQDKPQPIISDINLKRFKQEQSYMVDDLITIFFNKIDKETIPHNFHMFRNQLNIKSTRLNSSRLTMSRATSEKDLSKSMMSSLENNLIEDFSDGSFQKCMQYLQNYLNIQRPQFVKYNNQNNQHKLKDNKLNQQQSEKNYQQVNYLTQNNNTQIKKKFINQIPSIINLLKTHKDLISLDSSQLKNSRVNTNINLKQLGGSIVSNFQNHRLNFLRPQQTMFNNNQVSHHNNSSLNKNKVNFNYNPSLQPAIHAQQQQYSQTQPIQFRNNNSNDNRYKNSNGKPNVTFGNNSLYLSQTNNITQNRQLQTSQVRSVLYSSTVPSSQSITMNDMHRGNYSFGNQNHSNIDMTSFKMKQNIPQQQGAIDNHHLESDKFYSRSIIDGVNV